MHVYSEARRVDRFFTGGSLEILGALMDESHASCRDLYDCSCPELDRLCNLAKQLGAYGARLTGAGWCGCMVALVDANSVVDFIEQLSKEYYGDTCDAEAIRACFVSRPGGGAQLIDGSLFVVINKK